MREILRIELPVTLKTAASKLRHVRLASAAKSNKPTNSSHPPSVSSCSSTNIDCDSATERTLSPQFSASSSVETVQVMSSVDSVSNPEPSGNNNRTFAANSEDNGESQRQQQQDKQSAQLPYTFEMRVDIPNQVIHFALSTSIWCIFFLLNIFKCDEYAVQNFLDNFLWYQKTQLFSIFHNISKNIIGLGDETKIDYKCEFTGNQRGRERLR